MVKESSKCYSETTCILHITILRMIAWIFRFKHNLKNPELKKYGGLNVEEMDEVGFFIFKVTKKKI